MVVARVLVLSVESQLRKAANLQKKGQDREAVAVFAGIVDTYPGNQRALDGLRQIRLKPVLAALSSKRLEPSHLQELINLVDHGHLDDAANAAKQLNEAFSSHAGLANICGVIHAKLQNFDFSIVCFESALKLEPDTASTYCNLGNALLDSGQNEKAGVAFMRAVDLDPSNSLATIGLGRLRWSEGALHDARALFEKGHVLDPQNAMALNNLGNVLIDLGQYEEAIAAFNDALARDESLWSGHKGLGLATLRTGHRDDALVHYQRALALNPQADEVAHMVASLSGAHIDRASPAYVESLFDGFARKFDTVLTENLQYQLPAEVAHILQQRLQVNRVSSLLDIGCGTGLLAPHVRKMTDSLVGIDMSEKMLERAAAIEMYDELVKVDVHDYLIGCQRRFDLLVALDVFIYIGEMNSFMAAVGECCQREARLVISTELLEGSGFCLQETGRFAHSDDYVEECVTRSGLRIKARHKTVLRTEKKQKVDGMVYFIRLD